MERGDLQQFYSMCVSVVITLRIHVIGFSNLCKAPFPSVSGVLWRYRNRLIIIIIIVVVAAAAAAAAAAAINSILAAQ